MTDNEIIEEAIRLVREGVSVTPELPKVGDVVLAWADGYRYVVHRIIRINGDRVTLLGDGNLGGTEHCRVDDVKARVTHVVDAKGRQHDLYHTWRRRAAKVWFWLRPIRRYLLAIYRRVKS